MLLNLSGQIFLADYSAADQDKVISILKKKRQEKTLQLHFTMVSFYVSKYISKKTKANTLLKFMANILIWTWVKFDPTAIQKPNDCPHGGSMQTANMEIY